ncbi:MAG TPA: DUF5753 domain-containing protein [Pseudonocardiaceae bacterium]|jgi:hypothetical protein|nr:DUF5753 domain-containing protein [Pseudonocardiaceae bacterium]
MSQLRTAFNDWEANAVRIVEVAPLLVPGTFQVDGYVHAIMTAGGLPSGDVSQRILDRVARRQPVTRANPAAVLVLLGEHVLSQEVGGRAVAVEQARHLVHMACQPTVTIRLVPDHRDWHPGLEGAFTIVESGRAADRRRTVGRGNSDLATIVVLETRRSVSMLHTDSDVDAFERAAEWITRISRTPEESVKYLADWAGALASA